MKQHKKVLIIGLDGATFDIINSLIEEGYMPHLGNIIAKGAKGHLQSTIPPVTGPAWLSMATGMKPENTGTFDFFKKVNPDFQLKGISSAEHKGRAFWDMLSQQGKRVIIFNYPLLYPPYPINGYMVSGVGCSVKQTFTYPQELQQKIMELTSGEYEITVNYHHPKYDDAELFLQDLEKAFFYRLKVIEFLFQKEWDLFFLVFSETDWMQHLLWRYIDPTHPLHEGEKSKKFAKAFKEFWQKIDEVIGYYWKNAGEETNLLIVSDHGFGPNDQVFKINAWLEKEGFLKRNLPSKETIKNLLIKGIRSLPYPLLYKTAQLLQLRRLFPRLYEKASGMMHSEGSENVVLSQIDLEHSQAFDPGHSIPFAGIYLNYKLLSSSEERKHVITKIKQRLEAYGKLHGFKVEIWEVAKSLSEENMPDLLVAINDWRCVFIKDSFEGKIFEKRPYSLRHTGSHRLNGIFIAVGPGIIHTEVESAKIWDIAPTVLYLFGLKVPTVLDGRVLQEIFDPEYVQRYPILTTETIMETRSGTSQLSEDDEEILKKTLENLGYM